MYKIKIKYFIKLSFLINYLFLKIKVIIKWKKAKGKNNIKKNKKKK